ncbi:MAG: CHAT domain-containing tetratricopeptide repeat protein [Pyrinomonadaceae bacterium]
MSNKTKFKAEVVKSSLLRRVFAVTPACLQDSIRGIRAGFSTALLQVTLLLTANIFAVFGYSALDTIRERPAPPSITADRDVREIHSGETVKRTVKAGDVNDYQIKLEAGTSVEISLGVRDVFVGLSYLIPENRDYTVPGTGVIIPGNKLGLVIASEKGLVEPLVITTDRTETFIIRVAARVPGGGSYSLTCGPTHRTTERDRDYAQAGRQMLEIRQVYDAGRPLTDTRSQIEGRVALFRKLDDQVGIAMSLGDLAAMRSELGDNRQALECIRESREIFEKLGSGTDVIGTVQKLANIAVDRGDYQEAMDRKLEALALGRSMKSNLAEGDALFSLGVFYHRLADEQNARYYYDQALAIFQSIVPVTWGVLDRQVFAHTNYSNLCRGMNGGEMPLDFFPPRTEADWRAALGHSLKALELDDQEEKLFPPNTGLRTFNLWQIGNTYKELGDYAESLNYLHRALTTYKSSKGNATSAILRVQHDIADVHVRKGEYSKAVEYLNESEALVRQSNLWGYLGYLGMEYRLAGQPRKGLELLVEALEANRTRQIQLGVASSLFEIAKTERELGNFDNARIRIEEALQIAEAMRAKITADELKMTYFSTVKRYYDFYVDLLMQARKAQPDRNFDSLALEASEKARSRNLLDLITRSGLDIGQGVDPELLASERSIREQLSRKASFQSRLLLAKHTDQEWAQIKSEVSNLTAEFEKVQAAIKSKSPRYAGLTQPSTLNAKQIQQLLDSGTVLLEYSLGEKKGYLWVVSAESITSFDLPGRDELEKHARKVYELMTKRNRQVKGETAVQAGARAKAADAEYPGVAAALSEMLLGPAADLIRNKRLVVVPDGALNYISFAALPLPKNQEPNTAGAMPLGAYHEVVTLPSASTLARLREETVGRKPADKMVAIFADPVFGPADSRAGIPTKSQAATPPKSQSQNAASTRDFERAVSDVGLTAKETGGLPRLPFSRREADAIFAVSPKNLSLKEVDFKASKQEVFGANLDQYRILHFATHGLLDSQHPELSGVVLSLVDNNGNDVDGFLRLQDIYNLKLNADLVVLSACNTALGKEVRGEGLIGLTRGFMYAGAPRVIASLWKVDDAATAEMMTIFYRKMLVENLRPAAALRAAQTEMMKQPRWRSPYYWAPFVLQGEWK